MENVTKYLNYFNRNRDDSRKSQESSPTQVFTPSSVRAPSNAMPQSRARGPSQSRPFGPDESVRNESRARNHGPVFHPDQRNSQNRKGRKPVGSQGTFSSSAAHWNSESYHSGGTAVTESRTRTVTEPSKSLSTMSVRTGEQRPMVDEERGEKLDDVLGTDFEQRKQNYRYSEPTRSSGLLSEVYELPASQDPPGERPTNASVDPGRSEMLSRRATSEEGGWNQSYTASQGNARRLTSDGLRRDDPSQEIMVDAYLRSDMEVILNELEGALSQTSREISDAAVSPEMMRRQVIRQNEVISPKLRDLRKGLEMYSRMLQEAKEIGRGWRAKGLAYEKDYGAKSAQIEDMNQYINKLHGDLNKLETNYRRVKGTNEELRRVRDDQNRELQAMEQMRDHAVRQTRGQERREWSNKLQEAKQQYRIEIQEARYQAEKAETDMMQQQGEWDRKVQQYDADRKALQKQISALEITHETEKQQMRLRFLEEKEKMEAHFREQKGRVKIRYQIKNEQLKSERVNREHIKGLTDPELATIFEDFLILIENISLNEWDPNTEDDWPISEHTLQKLLEGSPMTSELKELIVQSYLWAIMYHRVFATPYQVFGDEGERRFQEWTDVYGTDKFSKPASRWPEPTEASEKTRYQTVSACVRELQMSDSTDGTPQLKRYFNKSISETADEICETLERVMVLELKERKKIHSLVSDAANKWLEICSQRYRIQVVLPTLKGNIFKARESEPTNIKLVKKPGVLRIGASDGKELGKKEAIANWEGELIVKPR